MPLLIISFNEETDPEQIRQGELRARELVAQTAKELGEEHKISGPRPEDGFYSAHTWDPEYKPGYVSADIYLDQGRTDAQKKRYVQAVEQGFHELNLGCHCVSIDIADWHFPSLADGNHSLLP